MSSAASYSTLVQELYVAYFGRPADYFGLQNFEAALAAADAPTDIGGLVAAYSTNAAVKSLVDSFGTSAESAALYGGGTTANFVDAIFQNLFNRAPAVAGLTFWVDAINSGEVTQGDAALAIAAGAAANTTTQGQTDNTTLANKLAVASNFTTELGTSSDDIVAYSGAAAATTARGLIAGVNSTTDITAYQTNVDTSISTIAGQYIANTYTLTTGVDTIIGGPGNDAFNAVVDNTAGLAAGGQAATLNAFDSITGGTQHNTLNLTDFGLGSVLGAFGGTTAITGITTLNINSLEGVAAISGSAFADALDLTGWANLTNLNILSSNGAYNNIAVGDNVALSIVTNGSLSDDVLTFGGSTVNINNTSGNYLSTTITGGAATTAVTVSGNADSVIYDLHNSEDLGYAGAGSTPGWSAGTNSITTLSASNQDDGSYNYVYSDAFTTLNLTDVSYTYSYILAAAGTRALAVNLDNDGNSTAYPNEEFYVEDLTATTVNVTATGGASEGFSLYATDATSLTFNDAVSLSFYDGTIAGSGYLSAADAKSVTISGAGAFTADASGLSATAAIDASASTGTITVELATAGGQSFVGGTGADIITVGPTQTGAVTGGNSGMNEIILADAPGATIAALASFSNFQTLGVSGTTSGDFVLTSAINFKSFDVQGSGGPVEFDNVAPGSTLSVENGNAYTITLSTTGSNGPTQTANLNIGTVASGSATYADITLEDSAQFGIGNVNLVSNVSNASSINTISTLSDSNLVSLTLSGTGFLDIASTITLKPTVTSFTVSNSLAASTSVSAHIAGLSDAALASLTFSGSAGTDLALLDTSVTSLTLVDNAAGAVSIDTVTDTALTTATFTNSVNTTAGTFTVGSLAEAGLTTLTLNGNVAVTVTGDTVTTGITVAGSTDNADVSFTSAGATASGKTDTITLGNGTDAISLGAGVAGSTQTVTLGNGENDSIITTSLGTVNATVGGATAGTDTITADSAATVHITAGNGTDVISATSALSTTVTVGSGANSITLGTGASGSITIGTHAATVADSIVLGATGATVNTTTAFEKISGLNNAGLDTITFADANASAAAGGVQEVTAADVVASAPSASDTTQLAYWIAAATGAAHSSITSAAGGIVWFQFETNTYIVETAAADSGTLQAGDTVVELTGTGYTFAKATAATGTLHLLG